MKWYYYNPLSYYRYFLTIDLDDKLGIIEVDYNYKNSKIEDFDYYNQPSDWSKLDDCDVVKSDDKKKIIKLLEKDAHQLIKKLFTQNLIQ